MSKKNRRRNTDATPTARTAPASRPVDNSPDGFSLPTWQWRLLLLAFTAGVFLLYLPCIYNDFTDYDDPFYVTQNDVVQRGLTPAGVQWAFTTNHFANWLPVTWLSHMMDVSLFGLNPKGHHATSVLLHAINALLVLLLVRRFTGRPWPSAAVAVLFAVHPLRVESVAWIAERKDLLAATFGLLTLIVYHAYAQKGGGVRYIGMLLLYAMGLMSKTMLVTWPALMLLLDIWPLRRIGTASAAGTDASQSPPVRRVSLARATVEKVPPLLLAGIASVWTVLLQQQGGALDSGQDLRLGQRLANAVVSIPRYLGKTFWPSSLSVFYPHPGSWPAWIVVAALMVTIAITLLVWRVRRNRPYLPVGWFWFLGLLVPVSGIIQAGAQSMADRYMYLPGIGLVMAIVLLAAELVNRWPWAQRVAMPIFCGIVAVLSLTTLTQQFYWRGTPQLFGRALELDPDNWLAHGMIGLTELAAGKDQAAMPYFQRSLELYPGLNNSYLYLGQCYQRQGNPFLAREYLTKAARQFPSWDEPHLDLAALAASEGKYEEADREFAAAFERNRARIETFVRAADSRLARGQADEADRLLAIAARIDPQNIEVQRARDRVAASRTKPIATQPGTKPVRS